MVTINLTCPCFLPPVIDPEVALKACQEVLLKVKLQNREVPEQQHLDNKQQLDDQQQQQQHYTDLTEGSSPQWHISPDTSSIKEEDEEEEEEGKGGEKQGGTSQQHPRPSARQESSLLPLASSSSSSKQSWLLRLFESKLFDVSMAISYLYKSKEPGVQAYIGNRLFSFLDSEVDFYLPQLLNMYVHMDTEVGDAIRPYLVSPQTPEEQDNRGFDCVCVSTEFIINVCLVLTDHFTTDSFE